MTEVVDGAVFLATLGLFDQTGTRPPRDLRGFGCLLRTEGLIMHDFSETQRLQNWPLVKPIFSTYMVSYNFYKNVN